MVGSSNVRCGGIGGVISGIKKQYPIGCENGVHWKQRKHQCAVDSFNHVNHGQKMCHLQVNLNLHVDS